MRRTTVPLVALVIVTMVALISAGCGSGAAAATTRLLRL